MRRGKFSLFTFSLSNFGIYYCEVFYLWANDFVSAKVLVNLLEKLNELLKRIQKKFHPHFNQTFHPWKRLFQVNRGHCTNIAWIESVPYIHTPASRTHKFFCDWNVSALKNMDRMDDWYVDHNCHLLKHQFRSLFNFFCSRFILQHYTSPSSGIEQQHKLKQGNSCRFESGSLKDFNISSTTARLAPGFVDANQNEVCT